jgi:hypothetical protein
VATSESVIAKGEQYPARLTTREFQRLARVFKDLLADSPLVKYSILAAGLGGACEIGHTIWLALRYLVKF